MEGKFASIMGLGGSEDEYLVVASGMPMDSAARKPGRVRERT